MLFHSKDLQANSIVHWVEIDFNILAKTFPLLSNKKKTNTYQQEKLDKYLHYSLNCNSTIATIIFSVFIIFQKDYLLSHLTVLHYYYFHIFNSSFVYRCCWSVSRASIPNSAAKTIGLSISIITQLADVVESRILFSGIERTFLNRFICHSLKDNQRFV